MADLNMDAIREAMARREAGGSVPATSQMTAPGAVLPTGGPNVPIPPTQLPPNPPQAPVAPQGAVSNPQAKPKLSQAANFDDETKGLVKQLITKLMSTL